MLFTPFIMLQNPAATTMCLLQPTCYFLISHNGDGSFLLLRHLLPAGVFVTAYRGTVTQSREEEEEVVESGNYVSSQMLRLTQIAGDILNQD
jgi:hypothetical protein